jgi:hypothetical protein
MTHHQEKNPQDRNDAHHPPYLHLGHLGARLANIAFRKRGRLIQDAVRVG